MLVFSLCLKSLRSITRIREKIGHFVLEEEGAPSGTCPGTAANWERRRGASDRGSQRDRCPPRGSGGALRGSLQQSLSHITEVSARRRRESVVRIINMHIQCMYKAECLSFLVIFCTIL